MGYWADEIVVREEVTLEEARMLAAAMVAWLADRRIIEDRQCNGCFGDNPCYPPGPDYLLACTNVQPGYGNSNYASFSTICTNGMRVVVGREFLWNSSGDFPPVPCPRCGGEKSITAYTEAGFEWLEGKAEALQCEHCKEMSPLPEWEHPTAGFAVLAFEFFNWPEFNREFLAEFSRRLGRRMSYFGGRK
ncbi:hypothetical protein GCM10007386_23590 [Pseudoduganella dura]|nr:hypothetical protein GCM10007386_23590 [Pseudoduganella dura]